METDVVGRGVVEILPDFKKWGNQLATDMKTARSQLDGSAAGLRRSAATVGSSLAKIGKGVGAVGLGVAAVSVKMASDFQAHTAVLQTAAGETTKGLATVRQGILNLATGTGTGIQNLTDGMYTIEKAGFRGKQGLEVLRAAAQGAREENAKLADVTNAMTSVMASYHLKASDSVRVMNAMKTAAGEGKITMEEFSGALSTVLPIASANKISFEDIAGSMATLTQHGTSAREATHELAATIRALAAPNNVASREMARFGLSSVDVSKNLGSRGLSGTVNMLVETILKKMGPAGTRLQNAFEGTKQSARDAQIMLGKMHGSTKDIAEQYLKGKITIGDWNAALKAADVDQRPMLQNFKSLVDRSKGFSKELKNGGPAQQTFTDALKKMSGGAIGLNTILQLTGESAAGNAERIKKVGSSFHDSSKDVEGWKTTAGLLSVQMDRVKAGAQVLAIEIGTKLIPVVSSIVSWLLQHKAVAIGLVTVLAGLAGALVGIYVASKVYAVISGIVTAAQWLWNGAFKAGRAMALGTRIELGLLWVQQKIVAAWSGVVTAAQWAWNAATQEGGVGLLLLGARLAALFVWQKLQATWTGIVTAAQWLWNAAMDANPIGLIILAIAALVAAIVWIATKTTWFQTAWKYTWGFIKQVGLDIGHWFAGPFVNFWLTVWSGIWNYFIGPIVHFFTKTIPDAAHTVRDKVVGVWNSMLSSLQDIYGWLRDNVFSPIGRFFSSTIPGWAQSLRNKVVGVWNGLLSGLMSIWGWIKDRIFSPIGRFFTSTIPGWARTLRDKVKGFFGDMRDGIGVIWRGVENVAKIPINWVIDHVWNHGIVSVWGKIAGWIGIGNALKPIKLLAAGGTVGNEPFGVFNRPTAIVGEGNPTHPEFVIPTDPRYRSRAFALWQAAGTHFMKDGGILGSIGNALKTVGSAVVGGVKSAADFLADPVGMAKKLLGAATRGMRSLGNNPWVKAITSLPQKAVNGLINAVKKIGSDLLGSLGLGDSSVKGSAQQFAQTAMKSFGWGPSQWPALKALWQRESGWNYRATNPSSGAYGIPQSLPASKMASAGRDWRTNPATQIRWGLGYIKSRYGSPAAAWAHETKIGWYAKGTGGSAQGWAWVGEDGPELAKLPAGTRIRSSRESARQVAQPSTIHLTVQNHGVIGSKQEVENWLVDALDQLRRKNRLPRALGGTA